MTNPTINVIRPKRGFNFSLPNFKSPVIVIMTMLILAGTAIGAAIYLYQARSKPLTAPKKSFASTTSTIGSDFTDTTWNIEQDGNGQVTRSSTALTIANASTNAFVQYTKAHTGDFSVEAAFTADSAALTNSGNITFGPYSANWDGSGTTARLKLTRIGDILQSFIDSGSGYVLVGTYSYANDEIIKVGGSGNITISQFSAQVNFVGLPDLTPTPGTPQVCTVTFTVLATVNTPTPTVPTNTPVPGQCGSVCSPADSSSCATGMTCYQGICRNPSCSEETDCDCSVAPTATPTPNPTSPPVGQCGSLCNSNLNCPSGMSCYQGFCRNVQCLTAENCSCVEGQPTPTTQVVYYTLPAEGQTTPTPLALTQAGSTTGTWLLTIGGTLLLAIGGLLLLAL